MQFEVSILYLLRWQIVVQGPDQISCAESRVLTGVVVNDTSFGNNAELLVFRIMP